MLPGVCYVTVGNPPICADCQSAKQQIDNLRYEEHHGADEIGG
jgi:hypothetical protein